MITIYERFRRKARKKKKLTLRNPNNIIRIRNHPIPPPPPRNILQYSLLSIIKIHRPPLPLFHPRILLFHRHFHRSQMHPIMLRPRRQHHSFQPLLSARNPQRFQEILQHVPVHTVHFLLVVALQVGCEEKVFAFDAGAGELRGDFGSGC